MEINKVLIFGFIITAFTVEAKCPKSSKGKKMVLRPVGKNKGGPSNIVVAEEDNENPDGKCSYEFLPDRFKWLKPSKTRSPSNSFGKRWFLMKGDEEPPPPGVFVYEEADDDEDGNNQNPRGSRRPSPKFGRKWFVGQLLEDMRVPNGADIYEEGDTDENHNLKADFGWPVLRKKLDWPEKPNINWESELPLERLKCPEPWREFERSCYLVVHKTLKWTDAEKFCVSKSADLVTIDSEIENQFVRKMLRPDGSQYFIGLYADNKRKWFWISGERSNYFNWGPSDPNNGFGIEDNAIIEQSNGFWMDVKIDYPVNGFICEFPIVRSHSKCPGSWTEFEDKCYLAVHKTLNWKESERFCASKSAHLVTIKSAIENEFVRSMLKPGITYYFIGLYADNARNFLWASGEKNNYFNWGPLDPNNELGIEYYVTIGQTNGLWFDSKIDYPVNGFICELPIDLSQKG